MKVELIYAGADKTVFSVVFRSITRLDILVFYHSFFHICRNYRMLTVDREEFIHKKKSFKRFDREFDLWRPSDE